MKRYLYSFLFINLILIASIPLSADEDMIKIGALFSVTGRTSFLGVPEKETVEMLVKQINAGGGINGKKVNVIIYDTEGNPLKTVEYATKLIHEDKVIAIIGPTLSGTSLALIDLATGNKIPLISCAASIKIVEPVRERKWIFKTAQSDRAAVKKIFSHLKEKGIKKIAFLTVSNAFGKSGQIQLERAVGDYGFTVLSNETFSPKETDLKPQLIRIKVQSPDAVICWGTNPGPAYVAKSMMELNMDMLLVQSHGIASKKFIELAGESCEGNILPAGRLLIADKLEDTNPQKKVLLKYQKDFIEKYGKDADTFGGHGYDAFMILVQAIREAGTEKAAIRNAIEHTQYTGISGIFKFSPKDHNGLTHDSFSIITIKNGEWAPVEKAAPESE